MFIPDLWSWFLPIPDPGSRISDPRSKNSDKRERCVPYCSHKFPKIENYSILKMLKKKIKVNFQRSIVLFNQKLSLSSKKYGFGILDPRSGKNLFRIDPGSRGQKGTGSRIRIRNTGIRWRKRRQTGKLFERWICRRAFRVFVHKHESVERWPRNYLLIISRNETCVKFSI